MPNKDTDFYCYCNCHDPVNASFACKHCSGTTTKSSASSPEKDTEMDEILKITWRTPRGDVVYAYDYGANAYLEAYATNKVLEELESLSHEPQMHGDWQTVIQDRIAKYKEEV